MKFADKLQRHRKRLKLTQPDAARIIAIPFRTYCRYENGSVEPPVALQEGAIARLRKQPTPKGAK